MHSGIANFDLSRVARSRVTSSLDDKMASAADASTGNSETKTQINVNWTNDEVAAIIDIWANVEIQDDNRALRITIRVNSFLLRWLYRRTRFTCRFCDNGQ